MSLGPLILDHSVLEHVSPGNAKYVLCMCNLWGLVCADVTAPPHNLNVLVPGH